MPAFKKPAKRINNKLKTFWFKFFFYPKWLQFLSIVEEKKIIKLLSERPGSNFTKIRGASAACETPKGHREIITNYLQMDGYTSCKLGV